ncbi:MAG: AAA family ATPase [Deltaproteobacteria bacterium]|nr:AAA family ATPase [Deltaproteobacteria bacterium]MCW5801661.1 AAA family ATPase [Deltaproteobacteria bacterium]
MVSVPAPISSTDIGAVRKLEDGIAAVVRGKPEGIRAAVVALLARGHLLIEDIPGVGKTTLARSLAACLGGTFRRIQFTSDLLPSDIVGVSIYDQHGKSFDLKKGPIFANVVLADEINRTTPRTQSALLEAMSEGQVSIDDTTHALDTPFMVLATQNPAEHYGTYPLPESQMDRFLLRISIGYPSKAIERELLRDRTGGDPVARLQPVVDLATVRSLQASVESIRVDDALLDYAMNIVEETRRHTAIAIGVSTRGALAWYRGAQASALAAGRDFVVPDDFKLLAIACLAHRLALVQTHDSLGRARIESERTVAEIIGRVAVPT